VKVARVNLDERKIDLEPLEELGGLRGSAARPERVRPNKERGRERPGKGGGGGGRGRGKRGR
jgi:hypothetical protein